MRRYVVEKDKLVDNIHAVQRVAGDAIVYGVLKGNGYGLGLEPMARTLAEQGVTHFAVTDPDEALAIYDCDISVDEVLLLCPVHNMEKLQRLVSAGITLSVGSVTDAQKLSRAAQNNAYPPNAHIQLDTGLGRYGFDARDVDFLAELYDSFPNICFTGIYTHFSVGIESAAVTRHFNRFVQATTALRQRGYNVGIRHCCKSTALFYHPEMRLDAVRVGTALLGRIPGGEKFGLCPVGVCHANITEVKMLTKGDSIGYHSRYHVHGATKAAVVCVGEMHGFGITATHGQMDPVQRLRTVLTYIKRCISPRRYGLCAYWHGERVFVLGAVFSETVILDMTNFDCRIGDTVQIPMNPLFLRNINCEWV